MKSTPCKSTASQCPQRSAIGLTPLPVEVQEEVQDASQLLLETKIDEPLTELLSQVSVVLEWSV